MTQSELLRAYDEHLRTVPEVLGATSVARHGPLWLASYGTARGFVTYADLAGAEADEVAGFARFARRHFEHDTTVAFAEWKSRGHDRAPGLNEALLANGFQPEERESIMLGEARRLAVDVALPPGVLVQRALGEHDVREVSAMQDRVFGGEVSRERADELVARLAQDDATELWMATAAGEIVSAGRLELVGGTPFAGLWGGATLPAWRGRGIYRAITAARARSAFARGKTYLHSDSTDFSRPILERSGLARVSTTTPYVWRR